MSDAVKLDRIIEQLNAGVDPESLGVTLVKVEQEESELDFFKRHFERR